jgi:hypothetical protein
MKEYKTLSKTKKKTLIDSIKKAKEMYDHKAKNNSSNNINSDNNISSRENTKDKRNTKNKSK